MTAHSKTDISISQTAAVEPDTTWTEEEFYSQIFETMSRIEALTLENNIEFKDFKPIKYLPGLTPFPEYLATQETSYFDEDGLDWRADDYPIDRMLRNASKIFTPANGFDADKFIASMEEYIKNMPSLPLLPPSPEPSYLSCGDEDARTPGYETQELPYIDETCKAMENLSLTDVEMSD